MADEIRLPSEPLMPLPQDDDPKGPKKGMALCLSGGGYRAMVFHLGALVRLNEAGLLGKISRISSVSGGSITAGVLGLKWKKLAFVSGIATNLDDEVLKPVRRMASSSIDAKAILKGKLLWGTVADKVAGYYDDILFKRATLQDLPSDEEGPRFVINASNVQTAALWRFSKPYMADYTVGRWDNPEVPLSFAVAASSAFPPVLSPAVLNLDPKKCRKARKYRYDCDDYLGKAVLTDGGVYDNLGLEPAWKNYRTILVSDGGGKIGPDPSPAREWISHTKRILDIVDNQVRSLRKRQLIDSFKAKSGPTARNGAYWGIRTDIANYRLKDALPCPQKRTLALADTSTRLQAMGQRPPGPPDQLGLRRLRRRHPKACRSIHREAQWVSLRRRCLTGGTMKKASVAHLRFWQASPGGRRVGSPESHWPERGFTRGCPTR